MTKHVSAHSCSNCAAFISLIQSAGQGREAGVLSNHCVHMFRTRAPHCRLATDECENRASVYNRELQVDGTRCFGSQNICVCRLCRLQKQASPNNNKADAGIGLWMVSSLIMFFLTCESFVVIFSVIITLSLASLIHFPPCAKTIQLWVRRTYFQTDRRC